MRLATLVLLLAAPALAGCFDGGAATKAGGNGGPLTLRLATEDTPGGPASVHSREFARRVRALSHGQIRIVPDRFAVKAQPDYERLLARTVTSGEFDMGVMGTRFWEQAGVTSLRAFDAPLLVTSDALLGEIVSGDVADDMLSGLGRVGVVGLGLVPIALEHPFGLNGPLLGPADYAGTRMAGTAALHMPMTDIRLRSIAGR